MIRTSIFNIFLVGLGWVVSFNAYCSLPALKFDEKASMEFIIQARQTLDYLRAVNIVQKFQVMRLLQAKGEKYEQEVDICSESLLQMLQEIDFDPYLILKAADNTREVATIKDAMYVLLNLENQGEYRLPAKVFRAAINTNDRELIEAIIKNALVFSNNEVLTIAFEKQRIMVRCAFNSLITLEEQAFDSFIKKQVKEKGEILSSVVLEQALKFGEPDIVQAIIESSARSANSALCNPENLRSIVWRAGANGSFDLTQILNKRINELSPQKPKTVLKPSQQQVAMEQGKQQGEQVKKQVYSDLRANAQPFQPSVASATAASPVVNNPAGLTHVGIQPNARMESLTVHNQLPLRPTRRRPWLGANTTRCIRSTVKK